MASFDIEVLPGALREWSHLETRARRLEVAEGIERLRDDPRPPGSFRLVVESKYRLYLETTIVAYLIDVETNRIWILEVRAR